VASELNRDELAARCLVALAGVEDDGPPELARIAVEYADALIARLASRPAATGSEPAPVAPVLEPRRTVGAVVRDSIDSDWIVTKLDMARVVSSGDAGEVPVSSHWKFSRWATREECERHGIPFVDRSADRSVDRTTPAAAQDAGLTEAERVDLADAIRQSRAGNASIRPWDRLDTYDQKAALDRADAAAAWFAKRGAR